MAGRSVVAGAQQDLFERISRVAWVCRNMETVEVCSTFVGVLISDAGICVSHPCRHNLRRGRPFRLTNGNFAGRQTFRSNSWRKSGISMALPRKTYPRAFISTIITICIFVGVIVFRGTLRRRDVDSRINLSFPQA